VSAPGVEQWWETVRAAALVGTARREVPALPAELAAFSAPRTGREQGLLEAAALGDAVRRAGAVAVHEPEVDEPAPEETLAPAPSPAVQILELLLTQVPVGAAARDLLLVHWLEAAAKVDRVVPPRLLPALLEVGGARPSAVRLAIAGAVGERGAWLAVRNPDWRWLGAGPERREGPDGIRARIAETWDTDGAQDRAAAVSRLVVGLGPDDEPFLERCLDDRAKAVREEAQRLLDRLPGSARAARMGERLRPLLTYSGGLRKRLDILLPDDPDPAAVRDGLVELRGQGSKRARWRDQVVRGAPLSVWTEIVGGGPAKVVSLLKGFEESLVIALSDAAAGRGNVEWARALLDLRHDTRLMAVLPEVERDERMAARLGHRSLVTTAHEVQQLPRPWGPRTSSAVLAAMGREKDAGHAVRMLRDTLPVALHPDSMPAVERTMKQGDDRQLHTALRDVLQYHSLHRSISEAFR
jgi:hypothetical protein